MIGFEEINNVHKILSAYNLRQISDVNDEFRCVICGHILINARKGQCGCHYCEKCVNNKTEKESSYCPGKTEECRSSDLSLTSVDHRMNQLILKLIMKCPEEKCEYRCELINMKIHLEMCGERIMTCPWNEIGCNNREIKKERLDEHFQTEINYHNKLLLNEMKTLRGELRQLRENEEKHVQEINKYKTEIETLKQNLKINTEEIKILNQTVKMKKNQCSNVKENVKNQMNTEIENSNDNSKKEITDSDNLSKDDVQETNQDTLKDGFQEKLNEMKQELTKKLEEEMRKRVTEQRECETKLSQRMNDIDKYFEMRDGTFVWHIGDINKIDLIFSEYFYTKVNLYKMGLALGYDGSKLDILLFIYPPGSDGYCKWPFKAYVTMRIVDQFNQTQFKAVKKYCLINQTINNLNEDYDSFAFKREDLCEAGLIDDTICVVECMVEFE